MERDKNITITNERISNLKNDNIIAGDVIYYYIIHNYQIGIKVLDNRIKYLMIESEKERVFCREINRDTPEFVLPYMYNDIKINVIWKDKILKIVSTDGVFSVWKM